MNHEQFERLHESLRRAAQDAWYNAPKPFVIHRHKGHTKGALSGREVWRCPCGAIGGPGQPWVLLDRRSVSWVPLWMRRRRGGESRG